MEPSISSIIGIMVNYGTTGLLAFFWWFDHRKLQEQRTGDRKEMTEILAQYKGDMTEMRRMYESNVRLVEAFSRVAKDQKDVLIMNTQAFQKLSDAIEKNQFCPMVRLEKQATGVVPR